MRSLPLLLMENGDLCWIIMSFDKIDRLNRSFSPIKCGRKMQSIEMNHLRFALENWYFDWIAIFRFAWTYRFGTPSHLVHTLTNRSQILNHNLICQSMHVFHKIVSKCKLNRKKSNQSICSTKNHICIYAAWPNR